MTSQTRELVAKWLHSLGESDKQSDNSQSVSKDGGSGSEYDDDNSGESRDRTPVSIVTLKKTSKNKRLGSTDSHDGPCNSRKGSTASSGEPSSSGKGSPRPFRKRKG
jgi:hypothetical protein